MISFSMPCEQKFLPNNLSSIGRTKSSVQFQLQQFFWKELKKTTDPCTCCCCKRVSCCHLCGFHGCFFFRGSVSVLVPICIFCWVFVGGKGKKKKKKKKKSATRNFVCLWVCVQQFHCNWFWSSQSTTSIRACMWSSWMFLSCLQQDPFS